jgi:hypothetical protein
MPTSHTVNDGDCMSSLAARYGFGSYKTIYDDKANDALRKNRPSPNLLAAGDVVSVPDKKDKQADAKTAETTKFTVKLPKAELRLHLRGLTGEKLAKAKCKISVMHPSQAFTKESVADDQGLLVLPIPADAINATLEIELPEPPKPAAPPADGLVLPKETFTMKVEAAAPASKHEVTKKLVWNLALGTLWPIGSSADAPNAKAHITGAQRRLANLGYTVTSSGTLDDGTKKALAAFQDEHKLTEPTPLSQKTADQLTSTHDKGAP